jgi:6-phosphogluconolactonase/glucosamine-6-phosphate isomerase/deaminase
MLLYHGLAGLSVGFMVMLQILGFGADGHPILANFQLNTAEAQSGTDKTVFAATTARREKLTWDQISERSAKMVSFIGKCL